MVLARARLTPALPHAVRYNSEAGTNSNLPFYSLA